MADASKKTLEVFYSYSPKDEALREKLENQLGALKRQGLVTDWHHRELIPGTERRVRIDKRLASASIILLLISPDFIASDYCYSNEMTQAIERHNTGQARVIPIILRPTDYEGTPFETLQALPFGGKAVTEYRSRDRAFLDIAKGIRQVIANIHAANEQDTALDIESQAYCQTIYERGKALDFKGILHVNQNQPISIPLLDVFVSPKVAVGVPENEMAPPSHMDEDVFPEELREEYESVSRTHTNNARDWQGTKEKSARVERETFLPPQEQAPSQEKHLAFHLEELQEILLKHRRLVLLGDPGSGKSTLLRYLLLLLAHDHQQLFTLFPILAEENLAIPLYLPLAAYAEAWRHYAPGERSLKTFLERYCGENYLEAYSETILRQLTRGKVLLLFDGLDEIPDASLRLQIVQQVEIFTQAYPTNRFILTSRIVGYTEAPVSASAGYFAYVLAPFDEQQIKSFLQRWCPAYEREVKRNTDREYLQYLATKEAEAVFQSVSSRPAVRRLASNPLLLTILALLQRQGINLPAHRVELYDLCIMTLLDTWGRTKGINTTTTRFTRYELIKVLRPLAFWMHERSAAVSSITEEELIEQVIKQLLTRKIARSEDEALKFAEEFLRKVRGETGILVERGKRRYGFLHLTFEEYFAAGELEQREDCEDFIKEHLHNPRWREVILLAIGIPGILFQKERVVTRLVRQAILAAGSPFENWLHRDLLLAGVCLADDIGIDMECEDEIIERILCLVLTSPYDTLIEKIIRILTDWQTTHLAEKALSMIHPVFQQLNAGLDPVECITYLSSRTEGHLLKRTVTHHYRSLVQCFQESEMRLTRLRIMVLLCHPHIDTKGWIDDALTFSHDPDWRVREKAAEVLGQLEGEQSEILACLLSLLVDTVGNVRQAAAKALGQREHREDVVITGLLGLLLESNGLSKQTAAETLGQLGYQEPRIKEQLLRLLKDVSTYVKQSAIKTLWQLYPADAEVVEQLLRLLTDTNAQIKQTVVEILGAWEHVPSKASERFFDLLIDEDLSVRQAAAHALGYLGCRQLEVMNRLLNLLTASELRLRESAIRALGQTGQKQPTLLAILSELLMDKHWQIRATAAEALGCIGCLEERTTDHLLLLLTDPFPSVRQAATYTLAQVGDIHPQPIVVEKLLDLLYDPFPHVKRAAIYTLAQWADQRQEILEELLEPLSDSDVQTVLEAIKALGTIEEAQPKVSHRLVELLTYPLAVIRQTTATVAGLLTWTTAEIAGKLIDLLYDVDSEVRKASAKALKQLGNKHTETLHLLLNTLIETSGAALVSNVHVLKGLEEQKKQLNPHIILRLLIIVKSLGKGHSFLKETLFNLLTDSDWNIREAATEALGKLGDESQMVHAKLSEMLTDHNWRVRSIAVKSLGQRWNGEQEVVNTLLPFLFDYDIDVRKSVMETLYQLQCDISAKTSSILRSLADIYSLSSKDLQYEKAAAKLVKQLSFNQPEIVLLLLNILSDPYADSQFRRVAAKALGQVEKEPSETVNKLLTLLIAPDSTLLNQEFVITALGFSGKNRSDVLEILLNYIPNSVTLLPLGVSETIIQALGHLGDEQPKIAAKLFDFLFHPSIGTRQVAIEALGQTNSKEPETIARLLDFLSLSNVQVRTSAIEALGLLGNGQAEIVDKLLELVSSSNVSERGAALIALAKQSQKPMEVMDILLQSLTNPIPKRTWRTSIAYILASPYIDHLALSQQIEQHLRIHEPITKASLNATDQVERLLFVLQEVVGDVI